MQILQLLMQLVRYAIRSLFQRYGNHTVIRQNSTITKPPFVFVASIGNPDPEYSKSRHSVGHWVLEKLIEQHWTEFKPFQKHRNIRRGVYSVSETSNLANVLLFKSNETYMNLQGDPISSIWNQVHRIQSQKYEPAMVIIHDEILLPLGKIQIRKQGTSARGHNGLRSIDKFVGQNYTKIAVGIGKPPNKYVADYVLANFKKPEIETLTYDVMPQIADALTEMTQGKHIYSKVSN